MITANPSKKAKTLLKNPQFEGNSGAILILKYVAGTKKIRVIVIINEIKSGSEYAKFDCFT